MATYVMYDNLLEKVTEEKDGILETESGLELLVAETSPATPTQVLEGKLLEAFSSDLYYAPERARAAAKRAIKFKEKHGSEVKGGTAVGWARARQLANGEGLSAETVLRMSNFFNRHLKNKEIDPKFKDEPWKDRGYIAWLIWGGDAGADWAHLVASRIRRK